VQVNQAKAKGRWRTVLAQLLASRAFTRGKGRVPAVEVLLNTPLVSDMVFKGEVASIKELMKKSRELGMQTFDQHLFDLYEAGEISYEDALRNADSMNELRLMIKLNSKDAKDKDVMTGIEHLNLV
jgi:twitching motility protein PilU